MKRQVSAIVADLGFVLGRRIRGTTNRGLPTLCQLVQVDVFSGGCHGWYVQYVNRTVCLWRRSKSKQKEGFLGLLSTPMNSKSTVRSVVSIRRQGVTVIFDELDEGSTLPFPESFLGFQQVPHSTQRRLDAIDNGLPKLSSNRHILEGSNSSGFALGLIE